MGEVTLREYRPGDLTELAALFYETVHTVCAGEYTPEQLDAWAPGEVDEPSWDRTLTARHALVAEIGGAIAGFGDMDETGYLDRLYVHKDFRRRGVGSAICEALEGRVRGKVVTFASKTARPFFEKRGWRVLRRNVVIRRGVELENYYMEKEITDVD